MTYHNPRPIESIQVYRVGCKSFGLVLRRTSPTNQDFVRCFKSIVSVSLNELRFQLPPCESFRYGWATLILPFMEGNNLYDSYNISYGAWDDPSTGPIEEDSESPMPMYMCPSEATESLNPAIAGQPEVHAKLNYLGSIGSDYMVDQFLDETTGGSGMFYMNSRVRHRDILDGTSQTITHGERSGTNRVDHIYRNQGIRIGLVENDPGSQIFTNPPTAFPALELANQVAQSPYDPTRYPGAPIDTRFFGINGRGGGPNVDPLFAYTIGYSSAHPGGGCFVMADGSTLFINEVIDVNLFRQLLDKADGSTVDTSDFR